jgi:hypothetical protein
MPSRAKEVREPNSFIRDTLRKSPFTINTLRKETGQQSKSLKIKILPKSLKSLFIKDLAEISS